MGSEMCIRDSIHTADVHATDGYAPGNLAFTHGQIYAVEDAPQTDQADKEPSPPRNTPSLAGLNGTVPVPHLRTVPAVWATFARLILRIHAG